MRKWPFVIIIYSILYFFKTTYLCNLYFGNQLFFEFILIIGLFTIKHKKITKTGIEQVFLVSCVIHIAISILGIFFLPYSEEGTIQLIRWIMPMVYIAYMLYMLTFIALSINEMWLFMVIFLSATLAESIVGIFLMYKGVILSPYWAEMGGYRSYELYSYLGKRLLGLSNNFSQIAQKIFLCMMIADSCLKGKIKYITLIILLILSYYTFNRTAFGVSIILFVGVVILDYKDKVKIKNIISKLIILLVLIFFAFSMDIFLNFWNQYFMLDAYQGRVGSITVRYSIWIELKNILDQNPLFGNYNLKAITESGHHAHNSFIHILTTNGIIGFLNLFGFIFFIIKKYGSLRLNFYFSLMMMYSLTQFGLFWSFSEMDMFLCFFMIFHWKKKLDYCSKKSKTKWQADLLFMDKVYQPVTSITK